MGSYCEKDFNIINNYDGFAELIRIHELFSELMEIPPQNLRLSMSKGRWKCIQYLQEAGDSVHVDFRGKHYKTLLTSMNQRITEYDANLCRISRIMYKDDSKIDLIVFIKDNQCTTDDIYEFLIDTVVSIESRVPSSIRQRTLLFIDASYSGSFSVLHEYVNSFDKLCSYDEMMKIYVFSFLTECEDKIRAASEKNGEKITKEKINEVVTTRKPIYKSEITKEEILNKFNNITDDQFVSFLSEYHSLCNFEYDLKALEGFFSSPLWVFCSSSKESQTFSYPYRKFPRTKTRKGYDYSSDSYSEYEYEFEFELYSEDEKESGKKKKEAKEEDADEYRRFDDTPMDINLNDEKNVYIHTGSFFMNAIIAALFQPQALEKETSSNPDEKEEKLEKESVGFGSDPYYEMFKQNIALEMKRQESSFKEAFFLHHYESDLSKVSSVLSKLQEERDKHKTTSSAMIRQQIKLAKKEKREILKQIRALTTQKNGDEEQSSPKEEIKLLMEKLQVSKNNIEKLSAEKEEIVTLDSLINEYSEAKRELTIAITDIHSLFENLSSHQEKVFFSYNTERVPFPNFSSLLVDGKSLSSLKAEGDVDINDYIYFNHRYFPLLKKEPVQRDQLGFCYLPSPKTFSHRFGSILNGELRKHGYDFLEYHDHPDEYDIEANLFYNIFITNVEEQFSPPHGCRLGPMYIQILQYYETHKEIPSEKLMRMMLKCVSKTDEYWKKEYEKEEKRKKARKHKH